jgi:RNA-directed DNA polymerase
LPLLSPTDPAIVELADLLGVTSARLQKQVESVTSSYRRETRPKDDGTRRELWVPHDDLKRIQQLILRRVLHPLGTHPASHCCRGRDVITNALEHVGHAHVLICDIRSAFPSTSATLVQAALRRVHVSQAGAALIVELCTFRNGLPTGAPTSPALLDLVLRPIDEALRALAIHHGLVYTRYVDDFCISANKSVGFFLREVSGAVGRFGFHLARNKTRFGGRARKATVTGIVLAKLPSVDPMYRKRIREMVDRVVRGHLRLTSGEHRRLRANIAWIGRCHHQEAKLLDRKLGEATTPRG